MTHSGPDWGLSEPVSIIYKVEDVGELAGRINVVNTFDRRGNVVWWDDFEDNINKWQIITLGAGADLALSTDKARSGAKSAKLICGDATNNYAWMSRSFGLFSGTLRIGFELSFMIASNVRLAVQILQNLNDVYQPAEIRYNEATSTLEYADDAGGYTNLDTALVLRPDDTWHTLKLVVDFSPAPSYVRLLIDNQVYDMSALAVYSEAHVAADNYYIVLSATNMTTGNHNTYVDDVIITQNEP